MVGKDCSIGQIGWLGCGMVTVFANVQVAALEFFFYACLSGSGSTLFCSVFIKI